MEANSTGTNKENRYRRIFDEKSIAALSRIGEKDEKINYGKIEELLTKVDQLVNRLFAIIVPKINIS